MENNGSDSGSKNAVDIPVCDEALKPRVGAHFRSFEDGVTFYKDYAAACGFNVRKSTIKRTPQQKVSLRFVICSRGGKPKEVDDSLDGLFMGLERKRKSSSCSTGCKARIVFRDKGAAGYIIEKFIEEHNHGFVTGGYRRIMKPNRNLGYAQQTFIANCAKANVGGAKCFRIFKEIVGGVDQVGATKTDFKNMHRDMKLYAEKTDAQLLLEKLERRKAKNNGFFYSHMSDGENSLKRVFWADSVAVQNYKIFGEAVSADSTYSTNRLIILVVFFGMSGARL